MIDLLLKVSLYLGKTLFLLVFTYIFLLISTLQTLLKKPERIVNIKSWITVLVYNILLSIIILLFIQLPLGLAIILVTGKTPTEYFGGFPVGTIIYVIISTIIFTLTSFVFLNIKINLPIFDEELVSEIKSSFIKRAVFKIALYIVVGIAFIIAGKVL